jgi:hypothetical protein
MPHLLFGLIFMVVSWFSLRAQTHDQRFPQLTVAALNEKEITFPDDLNQEINILILVFERDAQPHSTNHKFAHQGRFLRG